MKVVPNLFLGLFLWVALIGNHYALEITPYPRYVHIIVKQLDANVTLSIGWMNHRGEIWPIRSSTLKLVPKKYDRWNGYSVMRPWGFNLGAEENCVEFQATQVRITVDDNSTSGWLPLSK